MSELETASATDQPSPAVGSTQLPVQGPQDGPQGTASPNNQSPNSRVTFRQKQAMLDFIMAHRELALSERLNEDLWTQLTNELNSLDGVVKPCEEWKKVWKIWCATYQRRRNDLSITLLDLKLITFLENITDKEKKKIELKQFAFSTTSLLRSSDLSTMISAIPQLAQSRNLNEMVHLLKLAEDTEKAYQTKVDFNTKTISDLMLRKQLIEKDILETSKLLDSNERNTEGAKWEKEELLKKIREYLKLVFSP